jgi:hypothetical protein
MSFICGSMNILCVWLVWIFLIEKFLIIEIYTNLCVRHFRELFFRCSYQVKKLLCVGITHYTDTSLFILLFSGVFVLFLSFSHFHTDLIADCDGD